MTVVPEALVAASLKRHLLAKGLSTGSVGEVLVDAHPSYTRSTVAQQLEPMGTVWIGAFRPDLVCSIGPARQRLVAGFEVKPRFGDWAQGLAQARSYRAGVHHAWLALPAPERTARRHQQMLERDALEGGVGLLLRQGTQWTELCLPADPRPNPAALGLVSAMLAGVPAGRRLQLNHPLNYLVVPYLCNRFPEAAPIDLLRSYWADLQSDGTRRHAIEGAIALHLIDRAGNITTEGDSVADLLRSLGFDAATPPSKTRRLAEVAPAIAAVCRLVLLWQPAVQLILAGLRQLPGRRGMVKGLLEVTTGIDRSLATSVFLADPSIPPELARDGTQFCPSTVFKLKQVMWHAGLLAIGAHSSAGRGAAAYRPEADIWQLEAR